MPSVIVHMLDWSPPCRAVMLTAKALGVEVETRKCDPTAGDAWKAEFRKKSPAHAVPVMEDGELILPESRAIMTYLANKYGKESDLYPTCPEIRAVIDARMYFDMGLWSHVLYHFRGKTFLNTPLVKGEERWGHDALKVLEEILTRTPYAAGDKLTLADIALIATVTSIWAIGLWGDICSQYPVVTAWYYKCKQEMPGYEELNGKPNRDFMDFIRGKLSQPDDAESIVNIAKRANKDT